MQNEDLDYSEVIRKGARIFLKPLVCFVNEKIQKEFGDDCIDIAKYIYSNSDGSNRELRVKNDRIQWDLYNIISFICIKNRKQKINVENEVIDFRGRIFHEIRDDHFSRFETLLSIRNQYSHETFDGVEQNVLISLNDAETYLNDMKFLLNNIPYQDQNSKNDLEIIIEKLYQVKINQNQLADKELKNKIFKTEKERLEYNNEEIEVSTINKLLSVSKTSRVNYKNKVVKCTILKFKDSDQERIMDAWCDPSGEITKKAEGLIRDNVVTTIWKPKNFDPQKWFRNIYKI